MKIRVMFGLFAAVVLLVGQAVAAPPTQHSEEIVTGSTQGNHELDCLVIRPWSDASGPDNTQYPVIAWANGWGYNDVEGEIVTAGYKPGLIEWALDGPYIVIAANQWSVQESDILACIQWLVDQGSIAGSEYEGMVNTAKIGLAGHSLGGGAVIKAGDGEPNGFDITAVIAMNPYGPSWVNPGNQDGPVMLIGGTDDIITPVESFQEVWEAIQANDQGGLLAVLQGGTHNDDAWGPSDEEAPDHNFGRYKRVTELWWQFHLNDNRNAGRQLKQALDRAPWDTQYAFTDNFEL